MMRNSIFVWGGLALSALLVYVVSVASCAVLLLWRERRGVEMGSRTRRQSIKCKYLQDGLTLSASCSSEGYTTQWEQRNGSVTVSLVCLCEV